MGVRVLCERDSGDEWDGCGYGNVGFKVSERMISMFVRERGFVVVL